MAWNGSAVFTAYLAGLLLPDEAYRESWTYTAQYCFPLFNDQVTPDRDAAQAGTIYGAGTWTPDREITSGQAWPAGGRAGYCTHQLPGGGAFGLWCAAVTRPGVTATGICGDLMCFRPGPGPGQTGIAFHDFGGPASVVAGILTLAWPAEPAGCVRLGA